jgi:multidrug efflux system membrane fusion protein
MSDTAPTPSAPRKSRTLLLLVAAVCLAVGGGAYWYKSSSNAAKQAASGKNRPMPVIVAEAKAQDVEVFLSSLGTVTPLSTVTVKSRVDGQLMQVLFREGQMVKAGDLLLVIDPRPFQVQLAQAEGQLKRDTALLENARLDLKRYSDLMAQGAIARQQYDTQLSLVHQYEGTVATDKATADTARLQITYSRITAPVSGQVGLRQVDPGNMVHASDTTGLLVVNQIAPISVVFTLPEDQLPKVLEKLRAGEKLRVDAYDRGQARKLAQGELASLDNQIDTSTGTVKLKASFANTKGELYPNQFVNAKLLLEVMKNAIVVPAAAVQRGQQGTYLYVVTPEGVAQARNVSVGEGGDGQSVILSGLALGEKVVVDGADRLRDGSPVEIKTPKVPAAGAAQNATNENATAQNATGQSATDQAAARPDAKVAPAKAEPAKPGAEHSSADKKAAPAAEKPAHKAQATAANAFAKSDAATNATTNAMTDAKMDAKSARKPKATAKPDQRPAAAPPAPQGGQSGSESRADQ